MKKIKLNDFEIVLKTMQKQLEIDKKVYAKTGCKTELMLKMENLARHKIEH